MWNTKKYIQYKYLYFEKCGGMWRQEKLCIGFFANKV